MRRTGIISRIIGILVGVVMAVLLIDTAWRSASAWFPSKVPAGVDDATFLARFVMTMPLGGQLVVMLGWVIAGFVGAFVALRISQWRPAGWVPAALLVVTGIWNITQVAQPFWLQAASVVGPLLGAWLAERHFHRARPGDPLIN